MNISMDSGTLSIEFVAAQDAVDITPQVTLLEGEPTTASVEISANNDVLLSNNRPLFSFNNQATRVHYQVRVPATEDLSVSLRAGSVFLLADNVQEHFAELDCSVTCGGISNRLGFQHDTRRFITGQSAKMLGKSAINRLNVKVKTGSITLT
ncbi:hypothetical protein JF50_20270 [Pseudoalteromonas luteoviolacea]|uniref:Adhesin domain-containing protein n=1 Tax=Pseudoalteromonas luteoviolacea TaxID=43657 RepID=A0A0C1MFH2_9GAMM|nr:hypothetical protein [Pseudoalteromonas luteoviolacea]KID55544.1 hypothetical protein JF50_20270 [Pseudoalteromonas luteoviolacea]